MQSSHLYIFLFGSENEKKMKFDYQNIFKSHTELIQMILSVKSREIKLIIIIDSIVQNRTDSITPFNPLN